MIYFPASYGRQKMRYQNSFKEAINFKMKNPSFGLNTLTIWFLPGPSPCLRARSQNEDKNGRFHVDFKRVSSALLQCRPVSDNSNDCVSLK